MSNSTVVGKHLPRLRRFGVMLLKSTALVDNIIVNCLEELVDDPSLLGSNGVRMPDVIFRMFIDHLPNDPPVLVGSTVDDPVYQALGRTTFLERQVFLLLYVEELNVSSTSYILDITPEKIREVENDISDRINS